MSDQPYDWTSIGKHVGGGALTGAGLAALYSYIKNTKRLTGNIGEDTSLDDDVLYIKGKKKRTKKAGFFGGDPTANDIPHAAVSSPEYGNDSTDQRMLNYIGAVGGGIIGYKGIKGLYKMIQEKQLQDELDDAQVAYMTSLQDKRDTERKKYAAVGERDGRGAYSGGMVLPATALLMLALASGVVSYKTLDESFPGRRKKNVVRNKNLPVGGRDMKIKPDTIKVLGRGNKVVKTMDADGTASDADEIENMVRSAAANPELCKAAGFDDLFSALGTGRTSEIKKNLEYGVDYVFDTIKGASSNQITDKQKNMAIGLIARDQMLKHAFAPLFASEFINMSPSICSSAENLDDTEKDLLCKFAAAFNKDYRTSNFPEDEVHFEKGAASLIGGLLSVNNIVSDVNEGTTFFASGNDSDEEEKESEEQAEVGTANDEIDGFFDKKMDETVS